MLIYVWSILMFTVLKDDEQHIIEMSEYGYETPRFDRVYTAMWTLLLDGSLHQSELFGYFYGLELIH